jgi:hypothetical protein
MIVTLPDDEVSAPRSPRGGNGTDVADSGKSQSPATTKHESASPEAGGALQTLFNVTMDCVRGRYDR